MEVLEHEILHNRLPNGRLNFAVVSPELNSVAEPTFNLYITFENNLPRIPLIGLFPQSLSSCDIYDEHFLSTFVNDFILFKRDFLDKFNRVEISDVLRIQFRRKIHDQLGVRFFYKTAEQNFCSDWYLLGLSSARTLVILDRRQNFQVLNEQAFLIYMSSNRRTKIINFECTICFEQLSPHQMVALLCGHVFCKSDAAKLSNCAICTKPKAPQFTLRVRDGGCPIDKCFNSKDLHILLPCCCVVAHNFNNAPIQRCPFNTCKQNVEKYQKLFFSVQS